MARGAGKDYGGLGGSFNEDIFPIVLSAPNLFGHPDFGDGTNQFVYGAQQPDGYLYIPGAIQVAGGTSADDTNWLIGGNPVVTSSDVVDLKIENPTISNVLTHQWAVSGNTISVNTLNNSYPSYQANNWIYKGLPSDNSGLETTMLICTCRGPSRSQLKFKHSLVESWTAPLK